jgi:transposase
MPIATVLPERLTRKLYRVTRFLQFSARGRGEVPSAAERVLPQLLTTDTIGLRSSEIGKKRGSPHPHRRRARTEARGQMRARMAQGRAIWLGDLDRTLSERVQTSPVWRERENLLRSVPSIGPTTALSMAALVASRHNPIIAAFYQRLCTAGKPKTVALTACMHRLLTILNAIVRQGTPWSIQTAP